MIFVMLRPTSSIQILDNTGVKKVKIINIGKKTTNQSTFISIGEIAQCVVKTKLIDKITQQKKAIVYVFLMIIKKNYSRKNGNYIRFEKNAGYLISQNNKQLKFVGSVNSIPSLNEIVVNNKFFQGIDFIVPSI
jgi:ribosomal protein L14